MDSVTMSDSRDQNEDSRKEDEVQVDDVRNTAEETEGSKDSNEGERASSTTSSAASVFQNFTVLRDFFLAAFSDGYSVCHMKEMVKFGMNVHSCFIC